MTFINDFQISDFVNVSMQLDWFQGLEAYNNAKQWLYNNGLHEDTSVPVTIEDPSGTAQTGAFVQYYTSLYNTNVPLSHFLEDASFLRLNSCFPFFWEVRIVDRSAINPFPLEEERIHFRLLE